MKRHGHQIMLTLPQAIGLLQRFMPQRNAAQWLENDRRYSPVLPFVQHGDEILYYEDELARFVQILAAQAALRRADRREEHKRRMLEADRRDAYDRRYLRRKAAANNLDRRFAVRPDRRSDLDRRIRGWVDRRCIDDRRML
jgi:hypothetical protein